MAEDQRVHLTARPYKGKKANLLSEFQERIKDTNAIEEYLNSKRIPGRLQSFTAFDIAHALGMFEATVKDVLQYNCGSNNITC